MCSIMLNWRSDLALRTTSMGKWFYWLGGVISLALGIIGVVLPLLPTTPFILLAAFCFSRSSPTLHRILTNHRLFGPMIRDWESYGVIPLKVKCLSTTMMILMVGYPLLFRSLPWWVDVLAVSGVVIGLSYVWSRPSKYLGSESN